MVSSSVWWAAPKTSVRFCQSEAFYERMSINTVPVDVRLLDVPARLVGDSPHAVRLVEQIQDAGLLRRLRKHVVIGSRLR